MTVTLDINDQLFHDFEKLARDNQSTIEAELKKAVILLTQKRALVRRLMLEVCDEFDGAMKELSR